MTNKPFDLVAIGESQRDIFYMLDEATVSCSIHKERCLLCLEYAEKIPVEHVVKIFAAGNSANVAVAVSRLDLRSSLITWVGKDVVGDLLRRSLEKDGVDGSLVQIDPRKATNEVTILNFKGERTQLVYFNPRVYRLPTIPPCRCIYYSAMSKAHPKADKDLLRQLKQRPKTFFVFQPGTTHVRAGLDMIKPLIARSDLFILNKDEAHHILIDGERPVVNLMMSFHRMGAKNVIITDGPNGAEAYDGHAHWHMPIFPGEAKERTGAGDSFASAVTTALLKDEPLHEALRWGSANSWSVVQKIGPQAGLLNATEMRRILKKFHMIRPSIVPTSP